jgi:hypothetical protein
VSWRDWFPWPIGTHWCWLETAQTAGFIVAVLLLLMIYMVAK